MPVVMPSMPHVFSWLVQSAAISTVLLFVGYLVAISCRQPADRLRVLQWTLGVSLFAIIVVALPANWKIAIPVSSILPTPHSQPVTELPQGAAFATKYSGRAGDPHSGIRVPQPIRQANDLQPPVTSGLPAQAEHASSASAIPTIPERAIDWASAVKFGLVILYVAGVMLCLIRWAIAYVRLYRLQQTSQNVPDGVRQQFGCLAQELAERVRLRMSDRVVTPVTWGLRSPLIMLPQSVVSEKNSWTMRYFLAHELAHVRRRDSWTWQLALCLHVFLFYHPLYWLLRRMLLVSMDRLADAEAAGEGETPLDYAAFLVRLARYRQLPIPQLTLGVADKHSQLRQRVEYLVNAPGATAMFCSTRKSLAIAVAALAIGLISSAIRLEERATADDQPASKPPLNESADNAATITADQAPPTAPAAAAETVTPEELLKQIVDIAKPQVSELLKACIREHEDGSITYYGFVTDAASELPIAGAEVTVHHKLSRDPKTGGWSTIEVTEHKSNAIGLYSFTLPAEQTAQSSLYIEVEAHHPRYASMGRGGYSHSMIQKNLEFGELPWYTQLKLWPGEPIEGTIVSPDGAPLADVEISMYSASDKATGFPGGSFDKTTTDGEGHFRIIPPTPGDGVLWILPASYSPQAHRIADRRGDWGELKMEVGAEISGRVIDVNGQPVTGVRVEARRRGDGEQADEFLRSNAVANHIGRTAVVEADGTYTLASLPDGDYTLEVEADRAEGNYDPPPLKDVFLRQSLTIEDGKPQNLIIQAIPHVVLQGTYLDSQNKPRTGHEVMLFGQIDDSFYFARSSTPGKDGKFELKIPHGLRETKLDLITNEHSALKWRMSRDEPLQRGRNVALGTVEDDIYGFEVVRYTAPILMIEAVDEQGNIVSDVTPIVTYTRAASESEEMIMYTTGSRVSFEAQGDGRHRSSQLLPDEPIKVEIKKEGFETAPQELTMQEGEEQKLRFVLTPGSVNN